MEQARQADRWQTQKFETELQCRRNPDQCPPLFEILPRSPREPATDGVVIPGGDKEAGPRQPAD
jgi:hypothetical protein